MIKYFLSALTLMLLTAGCLMPWQEAQRNIDHSKQLRIGMTKEQVRGIMGDPLTGELYNQPDCWYYYARTVWADGIVAEEECMPLVFEKGKLAGWGSEFYSRYLYDMEQKGKNPKLNAEENVSVPSGGGKK